MYNKINDSDVIKWLTRLLITHNFLACILLRNEFSNSVEAIVLVIIGIWLTWFHKNAIAFMLMLLGLYPHLVGYYLR